MDRAVELGRVVVTNDRYFQEITAARQREGRSFPGVLIVRTQRSPIGALVEDLAYIVDVARPADLQNTVIHIPL